MINFDVALLIELAHHLHCTSQVRAALVKGTNSNSTADRTAAIGLLVDCTMLARSLDSITATITFIRKKIKNESAVQRAAAVSW